MQYVRPMQQYPIEDTFMWYYIVLFLSLLLFLLFYYFIMKNVPGCKNTELNACSQLFYEIKNDTMNKKWF
jgi:uncharacterized integral membrane protein